MLTQSSHLSLKSSHTSLNFNKLQKIETDIFNRIVDLKKQKIDLLELLSDSIDRKYQMETQLIHHLENKRKKENKLVDESVYRPVIMKNIQMKGEMEELERKVVERSGVGSRIGKDVQVGRSRTKSVYDMDRSKRLNTSRSVHSKIRYDLESSKHAKSEIGINDDGLIDQIIQQRKQNAAVQQLIRQQPLPDPSQQLLIYRSRLSILKKLLNQKQQILQQQRLSKTVTPIQSSKIEASQHSSRSGLSTKQKKHSAPLPLTTYQPESDLKVQVKQLLRYIQQQQEQKKLLYVELNQFVKQMNQLEEENQRMRKDFNGARM